MTRTVFVEWTSESGDPPISYFVTATWEQEQQIDRLVQSAIDRELDPYVGEVQPMAFEAFIEQFRESWSEACPEGYTQNKTGKDECYGCGQPEIAHAKVNIPYEERPADDD